MANRPKNYCSSCGYEWFPRGNNLSRQCPSCNSSQVWIKVEYEHHLAAIEEARWRRAQMIRRRLRAEAWRRRREKIYRLIALASSLVLALASSLVLSAAGIAKASLPYCSLALFSFRDWLLDLNATQPFDLVVKLIVVVLLASVLLIIGISALGSLATLAT